MSSKTLIIAGNWKSNKTNAEITSWFGGLKECSKDGLAHTEGKKLIICVPFPYLARAKQLAADLPFTLEIGAQNVSPYGFGAYTGEVTAEMISEYAGYVIIGHSERRAKFHEDNAVLDEKVIRAKVAGLEPIFCIPDENTEVPQGVKIAAYEPVWAIGTGKADTPENADGVITSIKNKWHVSTVLYGGSVTGENINSFITSPGIDGVLPGKASLSPEGYWEMIVNATVSET